MKSYARLGSLLALGLAACAGTFLAISTPRDRITFSHEKHSDQDCSGCHESIDKSEALGTLNPLPKEEKCLECHEDEKKAGNCKMCHADPEHPATYEQKAASLTFPHKTHFDMDVKDCNTCHAAKPEYKNPDPRQPMAVCLQCHQDDYDKGDCTKCHVDLKKYPLKPIAGFSHKGDWLKNHGKSAQASAQSCAACHDQTTCATCHAKTVPVPVEVRFPEKVASDFIHRGDFLGRHAIEARSNEATCARCHAKQFCSSCHTVQNITPAAINPRSPHPAGYAFPGPASHANEARRDINRCAACHDQGAASNCVQCHKVGGIGGDPHPGNWGSRHDRKEIGGNAMCLYCHQ